ncbi:D-3-phosphoglycerate dehydrogenase [Sporomusaceae bacterium BoRhaA]|uniref:phosphoglycerate dehydrogenase n=1 Tax=Pelorhabdus rhamnosifermentans TaxID=2772457 RepID=UPI001C0606B3|nr:phosphoglycerate dehydrogenase [Pelorhabdus rhamnosifermentans]MBU2702731.1 D-3-phosphoglycerate dehydrogenase [Pelorhabdus rhamnosifermentans]
MGKVLITARSVAAFEDGPALLESAGHEVIRCVGKGGWSEEEMIRHIKGMDAAIIGLDPISAKVIEAGLPSLKIVARNGVGVNNVDVDAARKAGVAVTLALGGNTISVCELVFGLMISLARSIPAQAFAVRQGRWERMLGHELYGKVLGVIGTGNIGGEVIKRAHFFGMKIVAYDPVPRQELCQEYGVTYLRQEQVIGQADFLTLHVPAAMSTNHMMNKEVFGAMKPTGFLINTARGILVQENDLYEALQHGMIAGYGTDTLTQEPPQSNHPLFSLANVIVTPHCGAYTTEAAIECSVIAAQEVIRVLSGQAPLYAVNKAGK